jgi:cell wall-associated NlpC family hydrolase
MDMANKGDIVYVKRRGYRHFGIYTGNQQVIHY